MENFGYLEIAIAQENKTTAPQSQPSTAKQHPTQVPSTNQYQQRLQQSMPVHSQPSSHPSTSPINQPEDDTFSWWGMF